METTQIVVNIREVWLIKKGEEEEGLKAISQNKDRAPCVVHMSRSLSRQIETPREQQARLKEENASIRDNPRVD